MPKFDNQTIELAFTAVTALAVLLQAIVLLAIYLALRKGIASLRAEVEDLRSSLTPMVDNAKELIENSRVLVDKTQALLARVGPKAESTVNDMARVARGVRDQTAQAEFTAKDIIERTRRQTERLDAMATNALDTVDRAGSYVVETVGRPARQLAGIIAAAKAIVESLRGSSSSREPQPARFFDDEDRFV
jgi:uncharacterized protein YoxC